MRLSQVLLSVMCGFGGCGIAGGLTMIAMDVPGPRPSWVLIFGCCMMAAGWLLSWILDRREFGVKRG